MIPLAVGGALLGGGTLANLAGTYMRDNATDKALKAYQNAVHQKADADRAALLEEQGLLGGLAARRQGAIGEYLNDFTSALRPGTDDGFRSRQAGALTDVAKLTQRPVGSAEYAYTGAPRVAAEANQAGITGRSNAQIAEALLADYEARQIGERQKTAEAKLSLGEMLRGVEGKSLQERFQLARALRELDWQRKTAAMQRRLNDAQQEGQWLNLLGGLGQQAGGLALTAGLMGGPAPGAPTAGAPITYSGAPSTPMTTLPSGAMLA